MLCMAGGQRQSQRRHEETRARSEGLKMPESLRNDYLAMSHYQQLQLSACSIKRLTFDKFGPTLRDWPQAVTLTALRSTSSLCKRHSYRVSDRLRAVRAVSPEMTYMGQKVATLLWRFVAVLIVDQWLRLISLTSLLEEYELLGRNVGRGSGIWRILNHSHKLQCARCHVLPRQTTRPSASRQPKQYREKRIPHNDHHCAQSIAQGEKHIDCVPTQQVRFYSLQSAPSLQVLKRKQETKTGFSRLRNPSRSWRDVWEHVKGCWYVFRVPSAEDVIPGHLDLDLPVLQHAKCNCV